MFCSRAQTWPDVQARGAVAGERKPPPLVKVPVEESAPADMEVMRREIEKLDLATAELSKRIEAATKARQDEKCVRRSQCCFV